MFINNLKTSVPNWLNSKMINKAQNLSSGSTPDKRLANHVDKPDFF